MCASVGFPGSASSILSIKGKEPLQSAPAAPATTLLPESLLSSGFPQHRGQGGETAPTQKSHAFQNISFYLRRVLATLI